MNSLSSLEQRFLIKDVGKCILISLISIGTSVIINAYTKIYYLRYLDINMYKTKFVNVCIKVSKILL